MNPLWKSYQLSLLALVMWREARGEGPEAMKAVGCCIRNRVKRPTWWGKDYISVITKKWQFSSMAAAGDPQLMNYPQTGDSAYEQALQIAEWIIGEDVGNPFPGADSFYDASIARPKWATNENYCGKIGRIFFHNVDMDVEMEQSHD